MFFQKNKNYTLNLKQNQSAESSKEQLNQNDLIFPDNFLWGVSTSAYQIEGGIKCDWSEWEKKRVNSKKFKKSGQKKEDFICGKACNSYVLWKEDLKLIKKLNCNAYRLSIDWARIQPQKNTFNISAINHYREQLKEYKKQGLTTVLTIWHWTLPTWFSKEGGWASKKAVKHFLNYAKTVIRELDVYVDYWVTLNEPTIHITNGYLNGKFPPNKINPFKAWRVLKNLAKAHNYTYDFIHKYYNTPTSIAMISNYFEPAHIWNPVEVLLAKIGKYFSNDLFLNKIKNHLDYLGVDYYFHNRMVFYPPFKKNLNKKTNDLGWEIFPQGLYHILKDLKKYNKPIIILENGLADKDDKYRADFIRDHLFYAHKAIQEGVDLRGYFHWSLLDNFEWDKGWSPKFGLHSFDKKTFVRSPRPSAKVYGKICKDNGLKIS